jgi:hypothetical protein
MRISFRPFSGWLYTSTSNITPGPALGYAYRDGDVMVMRYRDGTEKRI